MYRVWFSLSGSGIIPGFGCGCDFINKTKREMICEAANGGERERERERVGVGSRVNFAKCEVIPSIFYISLFSWMVS